MPFISEMVKPTSHLFLLKWTHFLMGTHGKKLQQPPWGERDCKPPALETVIFVLSVLKGNIGKGKFCCRVVKNRTYVPSLDRFKIKLRK